MSSNKTIFPGMENSYDASFKQNVNVNGAGVQFGQGGTVFPGMSQTSTIPNQQVNSKPVVGFLFSVSRTPAGEYWPLHIGLNTIGRTQECDVCLNEATVTAQHAKLVVRVMKNPEKTICSLQDASSTCGSMINGNSLGFDPVECHNGDIITIGEHYQLYLILVDTKTLGLSVNPDFISAATEDPLPPFGGGNDPWAGPAPTGGPGFSSDASSLHGTVGMDGSAPVFKKGSTIIMPK